MVAQTLPLISRTGNHIDDVLTFHCTGGLVNKATADTSLSSDKNSCCAAAATKVLCLQAHLSAAVVQHAKDVNDLQQSSSQLS